MHEEPRIESDVTMKTRDRGFEDYDPPSAPTPYNHYIRAYQAELRRSEQDLEQGHQLSHRSGYYASPHGASPGHGLYMPYVGPFHPDYTFDRYYGQQHLTNRYPMLPPGMYPYHFAHSHHHPYHFPSAPHSDRGVTSPAPETASQDHFAPLPDGTMPWYGRTRREVEHDMAKLDISSPHLRTPASSETVPRTADSDVHTPTRSQFKIEEKKDPAGKVKAKLIQPMGGPNDQYWVVHCDGTTKIYTRAVIERNFEGIWKVDLEGFPYYKELGAASRSVEW